MLKLATVEVEAHHEPPRPMLPPRRRVQVLHGAVGDLEEHVVDWGLEASRPIRFASSPHQGFLTGPQVEALHALYEAGATFALETDLLKPLGGLADTYTCRFDTRTVPIFPPADPAGNLYYLDMVLLIL
ncbi:MAG: hypothetical protein H0U69_03355 [Trueperaceae bacterium]|nr:hypothetical protein [Trueperaceae bacterium]